MIKSEIIVCEASPRWGPELQRQFLSDCVVVKVFSSVATLQQRVAENSERISAIVVNAGERVASSFQLVSQLSSSSHVPVIFIVLQEEDAALEWVFREVGAVNIMVEPFRGIELANCCRKVI